MTRLGNIEKSVGQRVRTEKETVKTFLHYACSKQYETEVRMDINGDVGYTYGTDGFIMDAIVHRGMADDVAIEAKQFVTNGDRLVKGQLSSGIGQALRYNYHMDSAELWHFYVVPYSMNTVEQNAALTQMADCHERVCDWMPDEFPVRVRSLAIRHTREEVQILATLGESVVSSASSEPTDLRPDEIPRVLQSNDTEDDE